MLQQQEILTIITARSGSKGVPKKNIRLLDGKPLIAYTVEAAICSQYIDRVIISTDSNEIADIAIEYGAEKLFLRPSQFSTDESPSWEAIIHALEWIKKNENKQYSVLCLLQPTSPLRSTKHLDEAIEKYFSVKNVQSLVSICESSKSPYWAQVITNEGFLNPLFESNKFCRSRRQEVPKTYDMNGAIYITKTDKYLTSKTFLGDNTTYYLMDRMDSIDIDTELDFIVAEAILTHRK